MRNACGGSARAGTAQKLKCGFFGQAAKLIGNTPLLELKNYAKAHSLKARVLAKLEFFNPAGSVKDRVALALLDDAEKRGLLKAGGTVIEPTSGNTGIALAAIGAARGYRVILTMPKTMSAERIALIKAYGAEVILTDGALGMRGAIDKAEELSAEIEGSFIAGQFVNAANPAAHYNSTAPEIWDATEGKIDIFVAGVGTGGTITGVGRYLKEKNKNIKVVAVEPLSSPVLSKGFSGKHAIQGIGAGFVPKILDRSVYDSVIAVADSDAFSSSRSLARTEGILAGISSGAALWAATRLAAESKNAQKTVAVIFPDGGEKYLSTPLYL